MRIDGIWKALLLGTVLVAAGACKDDGDGTTDDTDDTSDTEDTDDTNVPTEEDDCDDGDDNDEDGDIDCDDSDCASDADCAPEFFDPLYFAVNGGFTYYADTGKIGDATFQGNAIKPYVSIDLYEEEYFDTNGDERYACNVTLTFDGTPGDIMVWDFTDTYQDSSGTERTVDLTHAGFVMGTHTVTSDCTGDKALDPDVWGGTAEDLIANWDFGVGLGGWRPDVEDSVTTNYPDIAGDFVGGGMYWSLLLDAGIDPAYLASSIARGYAIDSAGELQVESDGTTPVLLDPADILASSAGVPPTGYYEVYAWYIYSAEYLVPQ